MVAEIVTLIVDIGLGALAYRMARTAKKDIAELRAQNETLARRVTRVERWLDILN